MMTLNLAVRNLLRNRRRSLATLLAMAIGSTSILLFGGYSTNINYTMHTEYVQTGGHLQIQHRDFFLYGSGNPTAYGIADYPKIIAAIQGDEVLQKMVLVASPTLQFGGIAGNYAASVSRTVVGNGFVPKTSTACGAGTTSVCALARRRLPSKELQPIPRLSAWGWRGSCNCATR